MAGRQADLLVGDGRRPVPRRRRRRRLNQAALWFIPACAGNSPSLTAWSRCRSVHPRVCGELGHRTAALPHIGRFIPACAGNSDDSTFIVVLANGSSPRVRGTPADDRGLAPRLRFIPACAGNSSAPCSWPGCVTVHPRVCGELAEHARRQRSPFRFIPACAGNSMDATGSDSYCTVHPRVCGELGDAITDADIYGGSSPRVRGTPPCAASCAER